LAKKKSISMAQIAMAWVFSKGDMMPICGLEPEKRIDQDVEAVGVTPERGGDETS
jgi:aryl-alcohol dehydrogenase-like predicted oxidoreductase